MPIHNTAEQNNPETVFELDVTELDQNRKVYDFFCKHTKELKDEFMKIINGIMNSEGDNMNKYYPNGISQTVLEVVEDEEPVDMAVEYLKEGKSMFHEIIEALVIVVGINEYTIGDIRSIKKICRSKEWVFIVRFEKYSKVAIMQKQFGRYQRLPFIIVKNDVIAKYIHYTDASTKVI